MYIFLSILIALCSILLMGVVLIQKSKGGGLASNYAGGNQFMGYRKTTDFIEKATWTLAIVICVLSIAATFLVKPVAAESAIKETATQTTAPAPAQQTPAQSAPVKAAPTQQTPGK